jgi:hypothetical protein
VGGAHCQPGIKRALSRRLCKWFERSRKAVE